MKTMWLALALLLAPLAGLPNGTIDQDKFEVCDSAHIYRVDDSLLAANYGSAPLVESNPQFPGGLEALQKFFDENLKLGAEAQNVFGRIPIAFVVSCKGKVGNFKFIGRIFPEMARDIIKVAEKMPDWNAGKVKDKEVDTYERLSFTIAQGHATVGIGK